ncbi:hypothetical protein ABAC402_10635 [Asticcacaulis sp. AC402]|nr:hypothetical protein ABAC402_10635 [Asticcacaulis sp. AC402]
MLLAKRTTLTDAPLARGMPRQAIEQKLTHAGYRREDRIVLGFPGAEAWSLLVVGACNEDLNVFVAFDTSDRLVQAEGISHEAGCL